MKNAFGVYGLLAILLLTSNGWSAQETYTFDAPVVDKIIVEAERCKSIQASLVQCIDMEGLCREEARLNTEQLNKCESSNDELEAIIKKQQSTLEDVHRLIEDERDKAWWGKLWVGIQSGIGGVILGILIKALILL